MQIILPLSFAVLFILSHSYDLDPVLVFMKQSETVRLALVPVGFPFTANQADCRRCASQTPFKTLRIREPYVYKLLLGRAIWVTTLTIAIVAIITVIFWAVPGHRL